VEIRWSADDGPVDGDTDMQRPLPGMVSFSENVRPMSKGRHSRDDASENFSKYIL
jgi:hypothetical protein